MQCFYFLFFLFRKPNFAVFFILPMERDIRIIRLSIIAFKSGASTRHVKKIAEKISKLHGISKLPSHKLEISQINLHYKF